MIEIKDYIKGQSSQPADRQTDSERKKESMESCHVMSCPVIGPNVTVPVFFLSWENLDSVVVSPPLPEQTLVYSQVAQYVAYRVC